MGLAVVFQLGTQRCGLPLERVERAVRAVQYTALPNAPAIVLGVVNLQGRIVPVFNLRRRLGLPERALQLTDQLLIANSASRTMALVVDSVAAVTEYDGAAFTAAAQLAPGLETLAGAVRLPDGILFVHDLDRFLSPDDERVLDEALRDV